MPIMVAMFDREMNCLAVSDNWCRFRGVVRRDLLGENHYKNFPNTKAEWRAAHQKGLNGEIISNNEDFFINQNGKKVWFSWDLQPWFGSNGRIGGILMYAHDISDKKKIEYSFNQNEVKLRSLLDVRNFFVVRTDIYGRYTYFNPYYKEIFGVHEGWGAVIGGDSLRTIHADDHRKAKEAVLQCIARPGKSIQVNLRKPDLKGKAIFTLWEYVCLADENGVPSEIQCVGLDVTDRIKAQESLLMEKIRLSGIIEGTNVGTWEWNVQTGEVVFNERWANIIGYTLKELAPISPQTWRDHTYREDLIVADKEIEKCFNREIDYYHVELRMRHKNGSWVWIEDRGKVVKWTQAGDPLLVMGTHTDITEKKAAEQEILKNFELLSAQNERFLNFAHIVSHNLRSQTSNLEMLLAAIESETDEEQKSIFFDFMKITTDKLSEALVHLNEVVQVNVKPLVAQTRINLKMAVQDSVSRFGKQLKAVHGEVSLCDSLDFNFKVVYPYLEGALQNLISNAIKYRHPERPLELEFKAEILSDAVLLKVKDNGLGIDLRKYGNKIFGMYKTFHGNSDARGIGLFITKNQMEAIGGSIGVVSAVDQGAEFSLNFPYEQN